MATSAHIGNYAHISLNILRIFMRATMRVRARATSHANKREDMHEVNIHRVLSHFRNLRVLPHRYRALKASPLKVE